MKNSGSRKISERYVSALFDVVSKAGVAAPVEKDLHSINILIKQNSDFREFLSNPLLTRAQHGKIAENILKQIGADKLTIQFIDLLARNKRLELLPEIIAIFLEKASSQRGELSVELISAKSLAAAESSEVANALGKAYGKKVTLNVREDTSLLGGTIIKIGSLQLDGSLSGKINRLQQVLKAG